MAIARLFRRKRVAADWIWAVGMAALATEAFFVGLVALSTTYGELAGDQLQRLLCVSLNLCHACRG